MKNIKLTKQLNLIGQPVTGANNGEIGVNTEEKIANEGYIINHGPGPDLPKIKTEVKTRDVNAHSAVTIGRMTANNILKTDWISSSIREKLQNWLLIEHNGETYLTSEIYNFDKILIQNDAEVMYNILKSKLTQDINFRINYITMPNNFFHWEHDRDFIWEFRIGGSKFKKLKLASQSNMDNFFIFDYKKD